MLTIWGRKNSLNVQKVLWTCAELEIPFERIDWAGEFGGNDDPAYRAMNPNGRVPTIRNGDDVVWESNSCCRYLAGITPGGERLLPADPYARSLVERWMDWHLSTIGAPMVTLHRGHIRTPPEKRNADALEAARQEAAALFQLLDGQLADRPYLAGRDLTLADIGIGIFAWRWFNYPIERPAMANLEAWFAGLGERPGFKEHIAHPLS